MIDFQLDYIARFFQKISHKPYENYVLTRLWHKLDSYEIQMILQQYVKREGERHAKTDVFFPQIGLHIEVNEPIHYGSDWQIQQDEIRKIEIENKTGHRLETVDCRASLQEIHVRVDELVSLIKTSIDVAKQNGTFRQWRPKESRDPQFWIEKKIIRVKDEVIMPRIEDICTLLGADPQKTKKGFQRKGGIPHPNLSKTLIWWPSIWSRKGWQNKKLEDGVYITESHNDPELLLKNYQSNKNSNEKRIVFLFDTDILGFTGYYFMGIYELDETHSNEKEGSFWKRISTEFKL
jgi:SET and RING associated domain